MDKGRVGVLRQVDVIELASYFGKSSFPAAVRSKDGKLRKIVNSFDYLMYIEGMSFAESVKFLCENFADKAIDTIKKSLKDVNSKPKSFAIKEEIIRRQMEALGNPVVRVTMQKKDNGDAKGICYTGLGREQEFFLNVNQLIDKIHIWNRFNFDGWNIYITPIEYEYGNEFKKTVSILVDDVKDVDKIKKDIGIPNLILETSPNNHQVVYVVKNLIDYTTSKNMITKQRMVYNEIFRGLNRLYGDKKISGLRHCFRLAGYTNQKPNREPVFVRIVESNLNPEPRLENSIKIELDKLLSSQKINTNNKDIREDIEDIRENKEGVGVAASSSPRKRRAAPR